MAALAIVVGRCLAWKRAQQRKRIQERNRLGVYKPAHAVEEITKIERQIEAIEKKAEEKAVNVEPRAEFMVKF